MTKRMPISRSISLKQRSKTVCLSYLCLTNTNTTMISRKKKMFLYTSLILVIVATIAVWRVFRHPAFGHAPEGERLARIERSPNYKNGEFHNQEPTPRLVKGGNRIRLLWKFLFEKPQHLRPEQKIPARQTNLYELDPRKDQVVWLGHSSYLLQISGIRFLIDPVLTHKFPASLMMKPFDSEYLYKPTDIPPVDFLIITHDHWDHLDYATVKQLQDIVGKVVCPLGVGAHLEYWGYAPEQIVELDWYEDALLGDGNSIHCLPTRHFSGRNLTPNKTLWASFLLEVSRQKIYIGGDGGYDGRFKEIAKRFAPIDLAIMENGQYNEDWHFVHLLPEELKTAIKDLQASKVLTVHHGKFALARHAWNEPLRNAGKIAQELGIPLLTPIIGEPLLLNDTTYTGTHWWENMK